MLRWTASRFCSRSRESGRAQVRCGRAHVMQYWRQNGPMPCSLPHTQHSRNMLTLLGIGMTRTVMPPAVPARRTYAPIPCAPGLASKSYTGVWQALTKIYREEGVWALWRGNATSLARVFPYSAVQLASNDFFKRRGSARDRLSKIVVARRAPVVHGRYTTAAMTALMRHLPSPP